MKLCFAILLISFILIETHGTRVKRGLSADEQKKFLDVLNEDRQEVGKKAGFNMNILKYDTALEKKADSADCHKQSSGVAGVALQFDSVAQELYEVSVKNGYPLSANLFWPTATIIGCSKTNKCSKALDHQVADVYGKKFCGKTATFQGACFVVGTPPELDGNMEYTLSNAGLPHPSKYGDLLGVPKFEGANWNSKTNGSASNSFFFQILLVLVFYI